MDQLVSIIIPLYNSQEHIEETIQSALSQTWKNIEIIIIDDGSTDQSLSIARLFECDKVKILTQENKGASAARNHGLEVAKGDYIQFLDADDLLSDDKIESQMRLLGGEKETLSFCRLFDLVNGEIKCKDNVDYNVFSTKSPQIFLRYYLGLSKETPHLGIHSWLMPLDLIKKAGFWNESLSVDDDGEFTLRVILEAKNGILFSSTGACYYRKHSNTNSLSSREDYFSVKSAIKSHGLKLEAMMNKGLVIQSLDKRFADGYKWLAISSYRRYPDLYTLCMEKVTKLGGSTYKPHPHSSLKRAIQAIFGWRALKFLELEGKKLKDLYI